ncbi:ABC transporter permease [Treponema sp. OMZ 838]|uniref:ABC transporter permease subunit n=1 Tax=Treponema sp. OMZ 838 TaxID=1539298 RepID=UPI00053015F8|nr:ABC transporter permease [Treponema sp. OMZ 838]AIW89095.1 ABC transporter permease [Treponema sp. OMZ 838]
MITAITLIAQAAPLLIAACAALVSEYAGLLNVGIEGLMLLSAFTGIGGILLTESLGGLIPGLVVSLALGAGLSMFITYLAIYRKANIYIVGLAVNLTAAGFVSILSTRFFGNRSIVALPPELLLQPQLVKTASAALAVLTGLGLALFCRYTKTGLRIKILGKDSVFLDSIGVHTARLKIAAMGMSGAAAALAGCLLSLQLGAFVPNQSAGKGWIALVLAYAGGRSVIGTICAALLFVYLENTIAAAQIGMEHPALLIGLPFVLGLFLIIAEKLIIRLWKQYRGK